MLQLESLKKKPALVADILLVMVAFIWGMGFPMTQMAIDANVSPGLIIAVRFWIASIVMGVAFCRELRTLVPSEIKYGLVGGTLLASAFILQTVGLQYTTPSNNAFLSSTNVVIVPFLSWILFKQRPGRKLMAVAVCCVIGAAILTISPTGFSLNAGDLLTLACALVFSFHIAYLGSIAGHITVQKLSFLQMLTSAVVGSVYLLFFERQSIFEANFAAGIWPVVYLGLFSTAFSFFAQTFAQSHTSPTKVAIILGCEGLLGSIFSVLLGYEPLTINLLMGGTVIFCSLLAMELDVGKLLSGKRKTEESPQNTTGDGGCGGVL